MIKSYVVDASVAIKWYLPEIYCDYAIHLQNPDYHLHQPNFFLLEIASIITKKLRRREIDLGEANAILRDIRQINFKWHEDSHLLQNAIDIANQTARSLYDCLYLSLAIKVQGQMVTADRKFYDALQPTVFVDKIVWIENAN
jgi:predicted nucleic acid-binding protein